MLSERPFAPAGVELADGTPHAVEQRIVGMGLEASFVSERQHLVVHPHGIADAEHRDAPVDQFLGNPVHGHVALGTHQHLVLAVECLVDGFDQCGGLARSRRPVYDGHVLGPEHFVHGAFLRSVQPGETERSEVQLCGRACAVEDVAQFSQASVLVVHHGAERGEHQFVDVFIKAQLYAQPERTSQYRDCFRPGKDYHHTVVLDVAHRGGDVQRACAVVGKVGVEEHDRPSELKLMVDVGLFRTEHFHDVLVERVVIASSDGKRIPADAFLYSLVQVGAVGLLQEEFFFVVVLHFEQFILPLEFE